MTELNVPLVDKIERYLFERRVVEKVNGELRPVKRGGLVQLTDLEILATYNEELRGICNYYFMASNFYTLHYFAYLMEYSCLKTLAAKHKTKISKIKQRFKDGKGGWCVPYETKSGTNHMYFAKYQYSKKIKVARDEIPNPALRHQHSSNSIEKRLKAKVCELCGSNDSEQYEVHHVKKLRDLKGKSLWEQEMIRRRRKTMVLCYNCHHQIHDGK